MNELVTAVVPDHEPAREIAPVFTARQERLPVSVVVATRDRPSFLRDTIEAALRSTRTGDELIVVDSASRDPAVRRTVEEYGSKGVEYLRCDLPGTSRARNAGWRAARHGIVAFTDDDCLPTEGWISALAEALHQFPGTGVVTGSLRADGSGHPLGRARVGLSLYDVERPVLHDGVDDLFQLGHGANMAWQREVLEGIRGFDEGLGPGTPLRAGEDLDAFWRALAAGCGIVSSPDANVIHRQWRSRRAELRTCFGYGVGAGAALVKKARMNGPGGTGAQRLRIRATGRQARRVGTGVFEPLVGSESLGVSWWRDGLERVAAHLSSGFEMGALAETFKLAGALWGTRIAGEKEIHDGHFFIATIDFTSPATRSRTICAEGK